MRARQLVLGRLARSDADGLTVQLAAVMAQAPWGSAEAGPGDGRTGVDGPEMRAGDDGEAAGEDRVGWTGYGWPSGAASTCRSEPARPADRRRGRPLTVPGTGPDRSPPTSPGHDAGAEVDYGALGA